ncbi:MAG: Plug domain-containing protein, partial [Capnocytophaga sp.]|nr:Plug domain-containing protein [Capnocytophaga sp.]
MKFSLLFYFAFVGSITAQVSKGFVLSSTDGSPVIGALLLSERDSVLGYTDAKGFFEVPCTADRICKISAFGYDGKDLRLPCGVTEIRILLKESILDDIHLEEVVLVHKIPLLEEFAVRNIRKLDVYTDPNAYGDVMRAVSNLASSTATDENAELSLRGTSMQHSPLFLNGVPIAKPFKGSDALSGIGTFSVLSTQMMEKINVYASNPPLGLGHSSGGAVEAYTLHELRKKELDISLTMSGGGLYFADHYKDTKSFFQLFSNGMY